MAWNLRDLRWRWSVLAGRLRHQTLTDKRGDDPTQRRTLQFKLPAEVALHRRAEICRCPNTYHGVETKS